MSVINRVLRDLEERNATPAEAGPQPVHVRAVARSGRRHRSVIAIASVTSLAVAAAGAFAARHWQTPGLPAHAPAISAAPAAPGDSPIPAPVQPGITAAAPVPKPIAAPLPRPVALWGESTAAPASVRTKMPPPDRAPSKGPAIPSRASEAPVRSAEATDPGRSTQSRPQTAAPSADSAAVEPAIQKTQKPPTVAERVDTAFRAGAAAAQNGHVREAESRFAEALALSPSHLPARQALLGLLIESRRNDAAEALVLEGLEQHPENAAFAMVAARLQVDRGDLNAAIATLERHETAPSAGGDYLSFHAALLQRAGRHAEAVDKYGDAIAMGTARAVWHMGRAISLRELGRTADARSGFQQALASGALTPEVREYVERQLAALKKSG
ncbi:MAG: tetratricopeptide repeat protein [Betaproteobacteria bacterium]|nr:tetratricopeptide repeat protein [Betaproteobacteria bacterium]